ncbi:MULTISPECIES: hypothetical protein [Streptomyces]|uniref:hypothetical protein n=1 Tax=Streptomyces TaxID=1883 RepID=UPI000CF2B5EB|nr:MULTISPECIES: hypothetical protein [Streptomyces]PPS71986.1 hypothetical protein BV882_20195 [Streptomyces sp. 46]
MSFRKSPASPNGAGPSPCPETAQPPLVRLATSAGRPAVLAAALALSAPGEYRLAVLAGWDWQFALIMPASLSMYAAVAAAIAGSLPRRSPERRQANVGAIIALALAMAAQICEHLISGGYLQKSAWIVVIVSATPPAVAAHVLHLTATARRPQMPKPTIKAEPTVNLTRAGTPPWKPAVSKWAPALQPSPVKAVSTALTPRPEVVTARVSEEPETSAQSPQKPTADRIVRALYDSLGGKRPGTGQIRDALKSAGLPCSDGTCREARKRVEAKEPELKALPPA